MATTPILEVQPSPWLSVWLKPRDTIERIVATDSRNYIFLLAFVLSLYLILDKAIAAELMAGLKVDWLDWRVAALILLAGFVVAILNLYVFVFCLKVTGRLLGGAASAAELRAVMVWSEAPQAILGLALWLAAIVWWEFSEGSAVFLRGATELAAGILSLWMLVVFILMLARVQRFRLWRAIINLAGTYLLLLMLALLARAFIFQPFFMPAGSMMPTLLAGDQFFVSKYRYGYTRFSLPFSPPLFAGRIFASQPQRGDVVVFRLPKDESTDYIKRLIGLPGDRIQMIKGHLHINGTPVQREQIDSFVLREGEFGAFATRVKQWRETLPNGVSYNSLDENESGFGDNTEVYIVPPDHYFVMGDNRDNSTDSRFRQVGYIPFENLIGRAERILLSVEQIPTTKRATVRFDRSWTAVR